MRKEVVFLGELYPSQKRVLCKWEFRILSLDILSPDRGEKDFNIFFRGSEVRDTENKVSWEENDAVIPLHCSKSHN